MDIGKKISDIRVAQGFSTEYVAKRADIELEEYLAIESGEMDVTFRKLERIANSLEYTVVGILLHKEPAEGIRNYFYNHNGYSGTNIHVQGIDQEEIRKAYKELYAEELARIPKLEKLLKENNIDFNF